MSIITTAAQVHATHQVEARRSEPVKAAPVKAQPVRKVEPVKAAPAKVVYDHQPDNRDHDGDRDHDRDHDRDRGHGPVIIERAPIVNVTYQSPYSTGYVVAPQAQPMTLLGATALDGQPLQVDVAQELGGMCQLDLGASGTGATYVQSVQLTYDNGATQVVAVNQLLDGNNPAFQIQLANAGALASVSVIGHSNWGGALSITAQ